MLLIEVIKLILENYIPLYYDVIFKSIFINKEYEKILKALLEKYLKIEIKHLRILNAELPVKRVKEQKKNVDLLIEINVSAIP